METVLTALEVGGGCGRRVVAVVVLGSGSSNDSSGVYSQRHR